MRIPSRFLRPVVQAVCLASMAYLFWNLQYPVSMPVSTLPLSVDPLAAGAGLIYGMRSWMPLLALMPVAVFLAVALLSGRVFCGWICPVGFLTDLAGKLRKSKNRERFGYLQFGILAAVLISFLFAPAVLSFLDPLVIFQRSAYHVWAGAGVPIVLLIIVAASLVAPRLWCRSICPLGGLSGILSLASPFPRRVSERCNHCMKCRRACTMGAISQDNSWDATACTKCLECEKACPQQAISFAPARPEKPVVSVSRRSFIAGAASLGLLAISKGAASAMTPEKSLVRPPGSLVEERFNAACVRCGSCARACTGHVIAPARLDAGFDRLFTPALDFSAGACQRCGTCGQVCPTGAIISIPEDQIRIGTAELDTGLCISWQENKKCGICNEVCPASAIKGAGRLRPEVRADLCVGCGSCQFNCPVEGKAIRVAARGEKRRT